jgi:hypothetical protein
VNLFVLEEFYTFKKVTYYTVRWDEADLSETDKFLQKYRGAPDIGKDLSEIVALLEEIGDNRGAKDMYFRRHAGKASELPPLGVFEVNSLEIAFFDNKLRLFCLKISEEVVILFNGGKKESQKTQDSPDLNLPFYEAQIFCSKILKALQEKTIVLKNNTLSSGYGDKEMIL